MIAAMTTSNGSGSGQYAAGLAQDIFEIHSFPLEQNRKRIIAYAKSGTRSKIDEMHVFRAQCPAQELASNAGKSGNPVCCQQSEIAGMFDCRE